MITKSTFMILASLYFFLVELSTSYIIVIISITGLVVIALFLVILYVFVRQGKKNRALQSYQNDMMDKLKEKISEANNALSALHEQIEMVSKAGKFGYGDLLNEILKYIKSLDAKMEEMGKSVSHSNEVESMISDLSNKIIEIKKEIEDKKEYHERALGEVSKTLLQILEESGPQKAVSIIEQLLGIFGSQFKKEDFVSAFMELRTRKLINYEGLRLQEDTWIYPY